MKVYDRQVEELDYDFEAGTTEYSTPHEWVAPIAGAYWGFDLDPCASLDSKLARENIRESGGLEADWTEYKRIWLNHPYGQGEPAKWLRKAVCATAISDETRVIALSKADPSTAWFGKYLTKADLLCFPNTHVIGDNDRSSRIQFVGQDDGAKFPNVYAVFGHVNRQAWRWLQDIGWVVEDP